MNPLFNIHDFTTTAPEDEFEWTVWMQTLVSIGVIMVMYCIFLCWDALKGKDDVGWDALSDFNNIKSEFKSIDSLNEYLSIQTTTWKMRLELVYLICVIAINTYTNIKIFTHYQSKTVDLDAGFLMYGAEWITTLEMSLSILFIVQSVVSYFRKQYRISVFWTLTIPNISALFAFTGWTINSFRLVKHKIFNKIESRQPNCCIGWVLLYICFLIICWGLGILLLVAKINQIKYIYNKDAGVLIIADYVLVVGTARQFANLYSRGANIGCWWFVFRTEHPKRTIANDENDKDWRTKYDADKVVCQQMVENHGLWGYLWLCYTFNNLSNVKKMYLQHQGQETIQKAHYQAL